MRTIIALLALVAALHAQQGGETNRVFHFGSTISQQESQELGTVIRLIADVQMTVNAPEGALAVRGTSGQVALAEWVFGRLDRVGRGQLAPGQRYEDRRSDKGDDLVRVLYLTNPNTVQEFQEMVTAVRSTADIRRMFTYNEMKAVVMRGTSEEAKEAAFLFEQMDKPDLTKVSEEPLVSTSPEFRRSNQENILKVFYLPGTATVQDFQQLVTTVRTATAIRRLFTYNEARAVAVADPSSKVEMANWLFTQLQGKENVSDARYRVSGTTDDIVRVFHLPDATQPERLQEIAQSVRAKTDSRHVFTYRPRNALAIRGTAQQIAVAEQLLQGQ